MARVLGVNIVGTVRLGVVVLGLGMALYHMISSQAPLQDVTPYLNTHLGFALSLVFLSHCHESVSRLGCICTFILTLLALSCFLYIQFNWRELVQRAYFNTPLDLLVGIVLIALVLEATRREFDWSLPVLSLIVMLYPVVGHALPEPFRCSSMDFAQTVANLGIGLQNGIFGVVLPTSANYLFLFVLFSGVFQSCGGTEFFMLLAKRVAGRVQGGPGIIAVVSSSLAGSIIGSAAANVVITGSFTIPLMKKAGYRPAQAAAIEAAASNGGQITPPVMGIMAFGMAGITGIPYLNIIAMALIPALLYFWATGLYVYLCAGKLGIDNSAQGQDGMKSLLAALPAFITPFMVILALFIMGYSVMFVAFWAIVSSITVSLVQTWLRGKKIRIAAYAEGFVKGAKAGAGIAASTACVGLILATVTMSGLGVKLASGIQDWSGGFLFPALLIIAVICIVMGCGGPSLTTYFIVSMFAVPAAVKMGVPFESAHFFTMYFGVFAFLTPPVAVLALIAAKLAGAPYLASSIEATKAAVGGMLVPFMFVYCPVFLLRPMEPWAAVIGIVSCIVCLWALEVAFVGYLSTNLASWERISAFGGAIAFFAAGVLSSFLCFLVGAVILAAVFGGQQRKKRTCSNKAV